MVNRTYACVNIVNLYITLVDFVVHVNLCNTTGQISASFDIASGEICGLVVKLCLMHFCDSYLARMVTWPTCLKRIVMQKYLKPTHLFIEIF